ncbi:secretin N-terminal domain-containing protein [Humisphaera borealis]|uniref:Type II secretion system protein GspD n=1 Tax=Humisphaera borealis TaxID=2807512 RepID=A0A7M2X321_9BACT|nr:secretin N-terminal domain-containing protein [Humisphaera borealis]QOV91160.1 hypothetical protein IPV69_07320 [Humisphaera borealis]
MPRITIGRCALRQTTLALLAAAASVSIPAGLRGQATTPATVPATAPSVVPGGPADPPTTAATRPASAAATSPATLPAGQISLNFKDTPVDVILDFLAESAGLTVVKEGTLDARLTVISKAPVNMTEAASLISTVLQSSGYTASINEKVLRIRPREKAKKGDLPVHIGSDPEQIVAGQMLITQVIPIKNVDALKLRQDLTPLLPTDADVTASSLSNAIVITDTGDNIRRVARVIAALDIREAASMNLKAFVLKYADAQRTATLLTTMFPGGGGGGQLTPQQIQMMQQQGQPIPMMPPSGGPGGLIPGGAVEQALKSKISAVADERTNTLFVIGPGEALKLIEGIIKDLDNNPIPASQLKAFPLKFADAETTAKLIASVIKGEENRSSPFDDMGYYGRFSRSSGGGEKPKINVTHDQRTNSVIVSAPAEVLKGVEDLIKSLDANPASTAELKVFQLKYADAWTTAKLLRQTFDPDEKDKSNPFGILFIGMGGGSSSKAKPRVIVSSDDRTNSIIVTAPTEMIKVVEDLVQKMDANPIAEEAMFIYRLRNGQAARLEVVLNTLFGNYENRGGQNQQQDPNQQAMMRQQQGSGGGGGGRSDNGSGTGRSSGRSRRDDRNQSPGGQPLSPASARFLTELSGEVFVVADRDTNALLVTTKTKHQERVKQIIGELDRPVPQVLIKVLVAEVTHDDGADFGVDFSIVNRRANGQGTTVGGNFGNASQATGLVVSLLEDKLNVTLHALATAGKLDVLSRPYILASDNQLASITVGNEVPFITNTRITDNGQQINTIQYQDVGIILNVTPHVNPDGLVIMDVIPEISQLTGTTVPISDGVSAPVIAKRSAESRVAVRTGQTIVIGGLMEDRKTSTIAKIPILGDIPIIGSIFARTQIAKSKTELLIFLTPHVAQQPEQMEGSTGDLQQGLKVAPKAIRPGEFDRTLDEQGRGRMPFTQPNSPEPAVRPIGP